ncbi:shikimate kinase-domain-containing protein, partial [Mycena floridula]
SVPPSRPTSPMNPGQYSRHATIVLIGMRGVGKTTLGTLAAKALGWELLDTDSIFERQFGTNITTFIEKYGWDNFRQAESDILTDVLRKNTTEKVIACGGGIVERESNVILLKDFKRHHGPVIHVLREKDAVLKYLR